MIKKTKTLKLTALLLLMNICTLPIYAQKSKSKFEDLQKPVSTLEELKINVKDTTLSASFRGTTLPVSNTGQLGTYLKNNPGLALQMKAFVQSEGKMNPEQYRLLVDILNKYGVHNIKAISFNKVK